METIASTDDLLAMDGVLGFGRGVRMRDGKLTNEPVVNVFVRSKLRNPAQPVPPFVLVAKNGSTATLPTDVLELPPAAASMDADEYPDACRPGDAVWVKGIEAGTVGCLARRRNDDTDVLVSCCHVLVHPVAPYGPGPVKNGRVVFHRNTAVGVVETAANIDGPVKLDIAVARITLEPAESGPVRQLRGANAHPRDYVEAAAAVNMRVRKFGAVTGLTCGNVVSLVEVGTTPDGLPLRNSFIIKNDSTAELCAVCSTQHPVTPLSRKGDSGALFVTDEPVPRAVGLLWGGDSYRTAYATPWEYIEKEPRLNVTIII